MENENKHRIYIWLDDDQEKNQKIFSQITILASENNCLCLGNDLTSRKKVLKLEISGETVDLISLQTILEENDLPEGLLCKGAKE